MVLFFEKWYDLSTAFYRILFSTKKLIPTILINSKD